MKGIITLSNYIPWKGFFDSMVYHRTGNNYLDITNYVLKNSFTTPNLK